MIRVAFVWPKGFDLTMVLPLSFAFLKSNTKSESVDIKLIDCSLREISPESEAFEKEIADFDPHVVGISSWSVMFPEALAVARVVKRLNPGMVTVLGGAHASSYPTKVMENPEFDYLVCGEAEFSFPIFLEEIQNDRPDWTRVKGLAYRNEVGRLIKNQTETVNDLDTIDPPDYDFINLEKYFDSGYRWNTPSKHHAPLWVTRGCPYRCTFCMAPTLNGRPVRHHSVGYMTDMIKRLYHDKKIRWFNIVDDNFTFNQRFAAEFCNSIIDLNLPDIRFATPNGIRLQKGSPELWKLMKRAGWRTILIAPETGSPRVLQLMKKDLNLEIVPDVVKDMKAAGLKVQAAFIIGYPGETEQDIELTARFIDKCKFHFVFLNNFQPLPGTPIYDELVENNEISDDLLPSNYSSGERAYTAPELAGFNFSAFVLKTFIGIAFKDPLNIPYMFSLFSKWLIIKKVLQNLWFFTDFRGKRL